MSAKQAFDQGSNVWNLNYSITIPADAVSIDSIELREVDTTVVSSVDCKSGVPVMNWNSPFNANENITGSYLAGTTRKFRYVICLTDKSGNVSSFTDGN